MNKTITKTIIFLGIIFLLFPIAVFSGNVGSSVSFSGYIQTKNNPYNYRSSMQSSVGLSYDGYYKVDVSYRCDSGTDQKFEEFNLFVDGGLLTKADDPNQGDDFETKRAGEYYFKEGTHNVKVVHSYDYNQKGKQGVYPLGVSFTYIQPSFSLTKQVDKNSVQTGEVLTYTINYKNLSDYKVTSVVLEDDYEESKVSIKNPNGGTVSNGKIRWNIGTVSSGDSGTKTFQLKVGDNLSDSTVIQNKSVIKSQGLAWEESNQVNVDIVSANNSPTADAGSDKEVQEQNSVTFNDASASDPDGDPLSYSWNCFVNSFSDKNSLNPTYYAPEVNTDNYFSCTLTVTDSHGASDSDDLNLTVKNSTAQLIINTNSATDITNSSARLNGNLSNLGNDSSAEVWFQWGADDSYGNNTLKESFSSVSSFSKSISSLAENKIYHFRAVAKNSKGTVYGSDKTFQTNSSNSAPNAYAGADKQVNEQNGVTFNDASASDPDGDPLSYSWNCSNGTLSDSNVLNPQFTAPQVSSNTSVSCTLTVTDSNGRSVSDSLTVNVKENLVKPSVGTNSARDITKSSAQLRGYLQDLGGDSSAEVWFQWGRNSNYGNRTSMVNKSSLSSFAQRISGLNENTTYHFRTVAENSEGTVYGSDRTFQTNSSNNTPDANAGADKQVNEGESIYFTDAGATDPDSSDSLNYSWSCSGGSLSSTDILRSTFYAPQVNSDSSYTCTLTVTDSHGAYDSDSLVVTVKNLITNPAVNTNSASNVNENSAVLNGNLSDLGGDSNTEVWFQWGRNSNYGNRASKITKSNSDNFSWVISGLNEDTTYHFRAVAENSQGTEYGSDRSFRTDERNYNNSSPNADAGSDKEVYENESVNLYGSGYDPDGDSLNYYWSCTSGSLSNRRSEDAVFHAPSVSSQREVSCSLSVYDGRGLMDSDSMDILIKQRDDLEVSTREATNVRENKATLKGYLNDLEGNSYARVWFQWGRTSSYGNNTNRETFYNSQKPFKEMISNLSKDTTYHFRAVAKGSDGDKDYGSDKTFRTGDYNDVVKIKKYVRNKTRGDSQWYQKYIHANPSTLVEFKIRVESDSDSLLENVKVKDQLPNGLTYEGDLEIGSVSRNHNITESPLNIGDLSSGETKIITFEAKVGSESEFSFGENNLINSCLVFNEETSESDTVKVIVERTGVAGISTGITKQKFVNSLLFPLIISLFLVLLFKSQIIDLNRFLRKKKVKFAKVKAKKRFRKKAKKAKSKVE